MAPKRPLGNPPPASSSDEDDEEEDHSEEIGAQKPEDEVEEEEEEEDEEEEDEEEEEEEEETPAKDTAAPPKAPKSKDPPGSSLDSDDTLPNASDFTIKPIARKPAEDAVKPKTPTPAPPTKNSKRPAETPTPVTPETGKKRKKTAPAAAASGGGDDTARKGIFQRIWSEEDEIAILEGMIKFQSEKGANPVADLADFNEYIKGSIHIEASIDQLLSKIRKMKHKYQNKAKKCPSGDDPVFAKPHDRKHFQLSKLIWGAVESNGTVVDGAGKSNNRKSKNGGKSNNSAKEEQSLVIKPMLTTTKVDADEVEFWSAYPSLKKSIESMPENLRGHMKDTMCLAQKSQVKELEDRWRKMNEDEFELYLTRTKLFLDMSQALGYGKGI